MTKKRTAHVWVDKSAGDPIGSPLIAMPITPAANEFLIVYRDGHIMALPRFILRRWYRRLR